jgi:hypothetical protein
MSRAVPWVVRLTWTVLPFAAGPALSAALDSHSTAVKVAAAVGLWAVWGAVLVGTLVPYPIGLTALRLAAPAAVGAAVAAALDGHPSAPALAATVLAAAVAFAPAVGVLYVNGAAYPNERRFPLRPPGALLLGPLPLAWALAVGAPAIAVLLLAARAWIAGAVVAVIGVPVAVVLVRSLHGLSRRWVVFVPAGLVLHDPMTLADPVLFPKKTIETLRPAPADSDSLDLTQRAPGLALELLLREKVPMVLTRPGNRAGESGSSARLLFTPTRPGQVLAEAKARRIYVAIPPPSTSSQS